MLRSSFLALLLLISLGWHGSPCCAQLVSGVVLDGDTSNDQFGYSVKNAGDIDGDGVGDILVGSPFVSTNGINSGLVRVFSGATGQVLYSIMGDAAGDEFGMAISAAGDVNGDSFDDFIVGAHFDDNNGSNSGTARVYSGQDGSIIHTITGDNAGDQFGISVAGVGDLDDDSFDDFAVGAPFDDNTGIDSGTVTVYSGFNGAVLFTLNSGAADDRFGIQVSGCGDTNADDVPDFAIGAQDDGNIGANMGVVRLFSGADGSLLQTFNAPASNDGFGLVLSAAGDVDGDGMGDIVVGAALSDTSASDAGSAYVFSGATGSTLHTFQGNFMGDHFGNAVGDAGDVNGDGFSDLIVGAFQAMFGSGRPGLARVFSGFDGSILSSTYGNNDFDLYGFSVDGIGDITGDGFSDVVVGSTFSDNSGVNSCSAFVFLAPQRKVWSFSSGRGPVRISQTWVPDLGDPNATTGTILIQGGTPFGYGLFGVSFAPSTANIFGFPLFIALEPANLITSGAFGFGPSGEINVTGISRQHPTLGGQHVFIQFFETVPIVSGSNGLAMLLVP